MFRYVQKCSLSLENLVETFEYNSVKSKLTDSYILKDVMGSDHCPVSLELEI